MADLRRVGLNNQKREVSIAVISLKEAELLDAPALGATLPERVLVIGASVVTSVAAGAGNVTIQVGGGNLVTNRPISAVGSSSVATNEYFPTGGDVTVIAGSSAPSAGTWEGDILIEYIEIDRNTRHYVS